MNGNFSDLNPETIEEEVTGFWRTSFKLCKSLSDTRGPAKTCEQLKVKVEQFQAHIPVIQVSCADPIGFLPVCTLFPVLFGVQFSILFSNRLVSVFFSRWSATVECGIGTGA